MNVAGVLLQLDQLRKNRVSLIPGSESLNLYTLLLGLDCDC
jgi:hypothetical protein